MDNMGDPSRQGIIFKNVGSASNEQIIQELWPNLQVKEKLGAGSFGAVYRVENTQGRFKLASAVKLIRFPQDDQETQSSAEALGLDTLEKLRSYYRPTLGKVMGEIRLMEELKTSGTVVTIQDFACLESQDPFCWVILIRMELLTSLADYRKAHELSEAEVIQVGKDMCRALEICHKRNIIHRDVKESNIFRSEHGTYKLGDFGISRHMEGQAQELSHKGTGSYMAPEILRGENYDFRVDIYALGISLYRLLNNNRLPFLPAQGPLTMETVEAANARRLSGQLLPDPVRGDKDLANILRKACAHNAADRFASAADFGEALDFYLLRKKERATGSQQESPPEYEDEEKTFAASSWQQQQMAALGISAAPAASAAPAPAAPAPSPEPAPAFVNPYAPKAASGPPPSPFSSPYPRGERGEAGPAASSFPAPPPAAEQAGPIPWKAPGGTPASAPPPPSQAGSRQPTASASFQRETGSSFTVSHDTVQSQKSKSKNKLLLIILISLVLMAVIFLAIYFTSSVGEGKSQTTEGKSTSTRAPNLDRDQDLPEKKVAQDSKPTREAEEAFEEEMPAPQGLSVERMNQGLEEKADVYRGYANLDDALEALDYETGTDLSVGYPDGDYYYLLRGFRKGNTFEGAILMVHEEEDHLNKYGKGSFAILEQDAGSADSTSRYQLHFVEGIHCWIEAGQYGLLLRASSGTFSLYINREHQDNADYSQLDYSLYECVSDKAGDAWYCYHYVGERFAEPYVEVVGAPDFWKDPRDMVEP